MMMVRRAALAAAAAAALATAARAQSCNVDTEGNSVEILERDVFVASEMDLKAPHAFIDGDGDLVLLEPNTYGGLSSQAWFVDQLRMGDGFRATFDFVIDGYADGIAFVVQNDKIINTLGGVEDALGFTETVTKYLGIAIESCSNFDTPCGGGTVKVWTRADGESSSVVGSTSSGDLSAFDLTDGSTYTAVAMYSQYDGTVEVQLGPAGGTLQSVLTATVGDLESILESRYAYVGFSASASTPDGTPTTSTVNVTGSVEVDSLLIEALPSNTYISSSVGEKVDWGRTYIFDLALRDNCGNKIAFPDLVGNDTYADLIWANLTNVDYVTENGLTDPSEYTLDVDYFNPVSLTETDDGLVEIRFDLPFRVAATWRLSVEYEGVPAADMPIEAALKTQEPSAGTALPTWGLALLIVVIVLIVLGLIYAVWRLKRYKDKLKQNEENIEAGKEKAKLDALDHEVNYSVNPMLGTPEEMKRKLAENERELERLRSGKNSRFDDASTIEELQRQNAELREEMNKLKREAQQEEALQSTYTSAVQAPAKTDRKEYGQGRA